MDMKSEGVSSSVSVAGPFKRVNRKIKDGNVSANMSKNILPASISNYDMQGQVVQNMPTTVGVSELLFCVKDKNGKTYVDKYGGLIYEPKPMKCIRASIAQTISCAENNCCMQLKI